MTPIIPPGAISPSMRFQNLGLISALSKDTQRRIILGLFVNTLTCPSPAVLRRRVGTEPSSRHSLAESPALYWPRLVKQWGRKWWAHTSSFPPTVVAGGLRSKIKSIHSALLSPEAGRRWRETCCSVHPTTEQLECFARFMLPGAQGSNACIQG